MPCDGGIVSAAKCTSVFYITAYDPFGYLLTAQENDARNARMRTKLAVEYPLFEGVGVDPNGEWKGEASLDDP